MKQSLLLLFLFLYSVSSFFTQELFPHNEPASNVGKNVLTVRASSEEFQDQGEIRNFQAYRFQFGLSANWMLTETFSFSNHHGSQLPNGFILHDSLGAPYTQGASRGKSYPYLFESMKVNLKYRFLCRDSEHKHFRMAAYADFSGGNEAHAEAEPNLTGDNSGMGAGIISTLLLHKFAASLNAGGILPADYKDVFRGIQMSYGKAAYVNLSLGYLLYPRVYTSYKQTNINLYAEFQFKTYGGAQILENGRSVSVQDVPALEPGSYLEFRPSIQFIIRSNTRVDLSLAEPLVNRSWTHYYPVYMFSIQQNIYFRQ